MSRTPLAVRVSFVALAAASELMFASAVSATASSEDACAPSNPRIALGFNLDLLPTVASAVNGKLGYAPQIWVSLERVRIRLVGAHLEPPDAFAAAPSGFHSPTLTAFAAVIDYTFGERLDGFWIGSGFEQWQSSIEHDGVAAPVYWQSTVFTLGGGYIWRVAGDFYIDPWIGAHGILNPRSVSVDAYEFRPLPVQAEASLKIGWFFELARASRKP